MNDLRGKVCRASNGSLGIPFEHKQTRFGKFWIGWSFNGRLWRSRNPVVMADTIGHFIETNQNLRPWLKPEISNDDTGCWTSPARPFITYKKPKPRSTEMTISVKEISIE